MPALSLAFILLLSFAALAGPDEAAIEPESPKEVVWIDVRSWFENQLNSIEGDPNIPYSEIVQGVTKQYPDRNTPVRLYCEKGGRAGKALEQLKDAGYSDVQNVGGIDEVRKLRFASSAELIEATPPNH